MTRVPVYLYVGSADVGRDVPFWCSALGAELVWRFQAFGADVAAVRTGDGPLVLLADHRPPGTCLPIWTAADLDEAAATLAASEWEVTATRVEVPDGPCLVFRDPSGNELALLRRDRPDALVASWDDPGNSRAIR